MAFNTVGFIGCGSMGSALARGVKKAAGERTLLLSNRTREKAELLARELGASAVGNVAVAERSELIFLGVKPHLLPGVLAELAPVLNARRSGFILVSMAAGVTMRRVQELACGSFPVIRIMPNTPCLAGEGVIEFCSLGVCEAAVSDFKSLIAPCGLADEIDESLMDAAGAVSGCGPAFLALAMEGMADAGVALGLPRDKALSYAAATIAGFGRLALETGRHPGALKDAVTSPGGSTIQGVRALEARGVRSAFFEAVIAAYERTLELDSKA